MQTPTWQSVGIPGNLVTAIKEMPASSTLDVLVHQTVFRSFKRVISTYMCGACGHTYVPTRFSEEVARCPACQGQRVRCIHSLKYPPDRKIPYYSRASKMTLRIVEQMNLNFISYFKSNPKRGMDWEWHNGRFSVAFAGGETTSDMHPRIAISKAAVLSPYLWDSYFGTTEEVLDQRYISHLLKISFQRKRNSYIPQG